MIENKIANSGLVTIDLEHFLPKENEVAVIDIQPFLFKGLILKEKDFREAIKEKNFSEYQDKIVGIYCSADAIIPMWAYMLLATALKGIAMEIYFGDVDATILQAAQNTIANLNEEDYRDGKIILKGCGNRPVKEALYIAMSQKLLPVVQSLMFGEACSTVPVYKRKKS